MQQVTHLPAARPSEARPASQVDTPSDRGNNAVSSSNQASAPAPVEEDGHVSDADSENVEEIPGESQPHVAVPPPQNGAPMGMPPGMPPGMGSEQMRNMMQNPQMMRQMTDMMSNMDPAQMQSMARMAGAPGVMCCFSQLCQLVPSWLKLSRLVLQLLALIVAWKLSWLWMPEEVLYTMLPAIVFFGSAAVMKKCAGNLRSLQCMTS